MISENFVFSGLFRGFIVKGMRKKIQRQEKILSHQKIPQLEVASTVLMQSSK